MEKGIVLKKKTTRLFKCGKCVDGQIVYTSKEDKDFVTVEVKKCNCCKFAYGMRQIFDDKLKEYKLF